MFITRLSLENKHFPHLQIKWTPDPDGLGFIGKGVVWISGNDREEKEWIVTLRQTMPLGKICVDFMPCKGGAWAFYSFEGTTIYERDLQWATVFAASEIKRWKMYHKDDNSSKDENPQE